MQIGKKLKSARFEKNYTQEYIASVLNISQKTYSNFENNITQPNINQLQQIAKALDKNILDFLPNEKSNLTHNGQDKNQQTIFSTNNISEKLIQQYEERIKDLKEQITLLKSLFGK